MPSVIPSVILRVMTVHRRASVMVKVGRFIPIAYSSGHPVNYREAASHFNGPGGCGATASSECENSDSPMMCRCGRLTDGADGRDEPRPRALSMSGHSKWSSIKHKKAARDSKRGKLFTKLIKEITIAARLGGGDINSNPRLRTAVTTARTQSMPNDNIDRAIKKGTGELGGGQLEEVVYEGYGPGGVAIITDVLTDNRNRVVAELRFILSRHGGNLGESNCVGWMFKKRGVITIEKIAIDEDRLMELALEAGADDVVADSETFQVMTAPESFSAVRDPLEAAKVPIG